MTWIAVGFVSCVAIAGLWPPQARAQNAPADNSTAKLTNEMCLGCHGSEGLGPLRPTGPGEIPKVLKDRFLGSVHGKRQCVECHTNITTIRTRRRGEGQLRQLPPGAGAEGAGREQPELIAKMSGMVYMIDRYMKSVHAQPSKADQSHTNATCYNCHDAHYVYPKGTPNRNLWRLNLPYTCGACHTAELAEYQTSVHGQEVLVNANPKAAVCSDCHTTHDIPNPFIDKTQLLITKNCGNCHQEQLASYQGTYHGQVNTLGFAYTAKCFDCHGYHTIKRVTDPTSSVFPANRLQTCQNCHIKATAGFLSFEPHATTHDFARYPRTWIASKFMILLLGGTFAFFWTHSRSGTTANCATTRSKSTGRTCAPKR